MKLLKNKKGDIPSLLFAIVSVAVAGIVIFVFSNLALSIYDTTSDYFKSNENINGTQADQTLDEIIEIESSIWDYAFLAIAMGYIIMMLVLAFSTNVSAIFYFVYAIAAFFSFVIGIVMSNLWITMAEMPQYATTTARFPITNTILGNFFPIFITITILITMIMLFGKFFGGDDGGGFR